MVSFVIPAHNEEKCLVATLQSVIAAATSAQETFEIIVVDDSSTDRTAEIAREQGARVVPVAHRQIAATRNSGARAARGDVLFFVDADTLASPEAVRAALQALRNGSAGGGCVFRFDGSPPIWIRAAYPVAVVFQRMFKLVGGCFLFCTAAAFERTGGFSEDLFAAEELEFIRSLKRIGRFVVPAPVVVTSGRKLQVLTAWQLVRLLARLPYHGPAVHRSRDGLELWYGGTGPAPR